MPNKRYYFVILAALAFMWFFTWASSFSLIPIWLDQIKGLDAPEIGIFFTLVSVTALCVQPLYGYIQDKLGLKKNLILFTAVVLVGIAPFYLYVVPPVMLASKHAGAMIAGAYSGLALFAGVGVLESYTERVSRLVGFEYGRCRSLGSLGYAAGTFCAGYVFNIDPDLNFYMAGLSAATFLVLVILLRPLKADAFNSLAYGNPQKLRLSDAVALLRMPRMWHLIIFVSGVSVYNVYDQQFAIYFSSQFMTPEEGNAAFGYLNSLQVFLEAGMLAIAPFIVQKIGVRNGLLVAGYIMAFRMVGSGLVEGPFLISCMKMLHGIELPILLISMFKYITTRFDHRLSATMYLVVFQFSTQIFATILSFVVGKLYVEMGFATAYVVMGCLVAIIITLSSIVLISDRQAKEESEGAH